MINFYRYQYLASKWKSGDITEAEKEEFLAWYNEMPEDELEIDISYAKNEAELKASIFEKINKRLANSKKEKVKKFKTYLYAGVAASILLLLSISIYYKNKTQPLKVAFHNELSAIKPGSTKATLFLEGGQEIQLSSSKSGISIGDSIVYLDGTTISDQSAVVPNKNAYAIITTPRGGEYKLQLEDGTVVWLNAETSIRFPSTFTNNTRKVELISGEAFFEVNKKTINGVLIPFEVTIKNQKIEVLGTAFNVKSYGSAQETTTTVSQGAVAVKSIDAKDEILEKVILNKGGQSILYKGQITKKNVDPEEFSAWKDGYFYFVDADIYQVINEFIRWYDIDVAYEISQSDDLFNGRIPKQVTLDKALNILKLAGVSFQLIDNKTLTIKRN